MKRLMLAIAAMWAMTFTACDPNEDSAKDAATTPTEDIDVTWTQDGNKVSVTVHRPDATQISNGKQTIESNSADIIMREVGENTLYISFLNADGSTTVREIPILVDELSYELPNLETIIWQGEQSGRDWDSNGLRFSDTEGDGLPTLSDETYDWLVGKKISLDISAVADEGTTLRVTNGWWSTTYVEDTPVRAGMTLVFEVTQELAYECKKGGLGRDLLLVSNKGVTISKMYYEP